MDLQNKSKSFGIDFAIGILEVENVKSAAVINKTPVQENNGCGGKYCIKISNKNEPYAKLRFRY